MMGGGGKELLIFEVFIDPSTRIHRNRVGLRNLVAKELKTEDGAIAVYVDKRNKKWRLSFIAVDYALDPQGNITTYQTASRRYTYLLGEGMQTRTAAERFDTLQKQSSLDDVKNAFSVEPLNEEFYKKLYSWYERAQGHVLFPNENVDLRRGGKQQKLTKTNLIRMLTRMLFIWFIKHMKLVSTDLFELEKIKSTIRYEESGSYYKAILQNLFFATLNTNVSDRRSNEQSVFRYHDLFYAPESICDHFISTPFLNGGLFECLDNKERDLYVDGFTDIKEYQPCVPNNLFFNESGRAPGLINIFNQYQFTTEESTPRDVEVALDPELLGNVFENLLASYNTDDKAMDRKATGSFYTPREIVGHIVDQSIQKHFKTHIAVDAKKIEDLFSTNDADAVLLSKSEIVSLIECINDLKILDPAVGSGAFLMGALHRLIAILERMDPTNDHFKEQQLLTARQIPDIDSRKAAAEAIENLFVKENKHNAYGKKLLLIEQCLYGVDIQPIAIQICKLRFFISLVVEQTPNLCDPGNNYGIRPLPNLETKFITADSLLPLGELPKQGDIFDAAVEQLQNEMEEIRHLYYRATPTEKSSYRDRYRILMAKLLEEFEKSILTPDAKQRVEKLDSWGLHKIDAVAEWFDPKWMFGVEDGFDVVLGNPPYVTRKGDKVKEYVQTLECVHNRFEGITNQRNHAAFFIEKAITLLADKGTMAFIVPHSISRVDGYKYIRKHINDNSVLWRIIDEYDQFANVTLEMVTLFCSKNIDKPEYIESLSKREEKTYKMPSDIYDITGYYPIYYDAVYQKMSQHEVNIINGRRGVDGIPKCRDGKVLCIGGKNIKRYDLESGHKSYNIRSQNIPRELKPQEIVITQFGASLRGTIIDTRAIVPTSGCVIIMHSDELLPKFILALINSSAARFFLDRYIFNNANLTKHLDGHYLRKIPVPKASMPEQTEYATMVGEILANKKQHKCTADIEAKIDEMVCQLYGLTVDETNAIREAG